jgi:O-acetyl-ADP-ribose deacetylase (regulator of RNase III)
MRHVLRDAFSGASHGPPHGRHDGARVLNYVAGDVTRPVGEGPRLIAHVCNDVNKFGAGVAGAIARRWPPVKQKYHAWCEGRLPGAAMALGAVQLVRVEPELWVVNMVAQHDIQDRRSPPPEVPFIRYEALAVCLDKLALKALDKSASVHMPRIGTGNALGSWDKILPLIETRLAGRGVAVTIYDLPNR